MICDRIKQLREPAGYSQAQLAKLFHVSADYLLGLTDGPRQLVQQEKEG